MKGTILVTGASGFVGRALVESLAAKGLHVRAAVRRRMVWPSSVESVHAGDLTREEGWPSALTGVDAVVHCAARVHVMRDTVDDPLAEFRRINVDGTLQLARRAAAKGTRRFLFLSSLHVNGEESFATPFTPHDLPRPVSPYALSKHEAELGLREIAHTSGMEVVIIRPPLVFGPNSPGNFGTLLKWLERGIPLPLGAIVNRRSFLALDNLVDFITVCLSHPDAANQTLLVSDGEDVSTTELLRRASAAMGRTAHLIPVPPALLKSIGQLMGKGDYLRRLCGCLQADISETRRLLDWAPPITLDEGLAKATRNFVT